MFFELALAVTTTLMTPAKPVQQTSKNQTIYVKESKEPCTGVAPMECLQIKGLKDKDWSNLYTNIEGFKYTPGYRYKLLVRVTPVKNPPADGSSIKYTLRKVLEKKKVNTTPPKGSIWAFIASKRWNLIKMGDSTLTQSGIWIEFDPATKRFHGKGGCNGIGGGYQTSGEKITFTMGISTKMACPDENVMRRETEFLKMISEHTYTYDVADQTLNFYENNKLVMIFGMQPKDLK
ncbi:DUF4377 domain-containing protein [Chitinophaga qingshengii]|uniref:DUF4377 domain-containing protein n=1 Tax=Chitinophaga qingshengii TaxID=1569794 RepID=A0ABR7TVD5_9BACT|nr:DUF4377 domain-containing protein [Chitinophaga qingshengii]MBC9933567.1 DUF4377 domain-containing protein [Chitinophaga qingshengii]